MGHFSIPNNISPGDPADANIAMANWSQVPADLNAALFDHTNASPTAGFTADQLADAAKLGISGASTVRRGTTNIATAQSTSSTSYTTLTTPDKVSSVTLPTDGLIMVAYQAIWQNSVASNSRAALFIGANQLRETRTNGAPAVAPEAQGPVSTGADVPLSTFARGLNCAGGTGTSTEVTTGQVVSAGSDGAAQIGQGGVCYIFAAAGTYDVSVQFKNNSAGTLTVKNRHLWVWTMGF